MLEEDFVRQWLADQGNITVNFTFNKEQIRAISRFESRLLVRARAGSGKTSVIVARVVFMIRHCKVEPTTVLLFAFNKEAAVKLENDLIIALGLEDRAATDLESLLPVVQTFDAFAHAASGSMNMSPSEKDDLYHVALEQLLEESENEVKAAMLSFFRADWERI